MPVTNNLQVVWLLGRGRTGTTWLARIMSQYSRCHYKHEPFLPRKDVPYRQWLADLANGPSAELSARFYELARGCQHQVDFPPFLRRPCRPQSPLVLRLTWQAGKWARFLRRVYEWYGRPRFAPNDTVLMKDVNFPNELLPQATTCFHPWIVSTFRNPYASVAATRRFLGQKDRKKPTDVRRVCELLAMPGHEHLQSFQCDLETMSEVEFEALRWRVQSEPLYDFTRGYERGMISVFEAMCRDPQAHCRHIFEFVGWEFDARARSFVASTSSGKRNGLLGSSGNNPHAVHRDSKAVAAKWRTELTSEEIKQIDGVIANSPILHLWPEIFGGVETKEI